jgi:hypothetical protein
MYRFPCQVVGDILVSLPGDLGPEKQEKILILRLEGSNFEQRSFMIKFVLRLDSYMVGMD